MVPKSYEQNKSLLGRWVGKQRSDHKNNELTIDRKRILDELVFASKADRAHNFNPYDKLWHQQCEKLLQYKQKNGHCMVPRSYEQDKPLANWVYTQRKYHGNHKLGIDRKRILNEIGFTWKVEVAYNFKPDDKPWHQHYEKLLDLKRINGNCKKVPNKDQQDKSLAQWVRYQRYCQNNNKMRRDRKELLDNLGFAWKTDSLATTRSYSSTDVRGLAI
jgi:hypothetical protein